MYDIQFWMSDSVVVAVVVVIFFQFAHRYQPKEIYSMLVAVINKTQTNEAFSFDN